MAPTVTLPNQKVVAVGIAVDVEVGVVPRSTLGNPRWASCMPRAPVRPPVAVRQIGVMCRGGVELQILERSSAFLKAVRRT